MSEKIDSKKTLIRKSALPLAIKIATAAISLLFNYSATLHLTPHEFGLFSIVQLLIIVLATTCKFGLDTAIIKRSALWFKNNSHPNFYYTALLVSLTISLSISWVFYLIGESTLTYIFNKKDLGSLSSYIAIMILPSVFLAINSGMLRGVQQASLSLIFSGLFTLSFSTVLILITSPTSAQALIKLVFISNCLACTLSFFKCCRIESFNLITDKAQLKSLLNSGASLWVVSLVAITIQQFSTLFLAKHTDASDVGVYYIALKVSLLMPFFLVAINAVNAPKFAQLYANGEIQQLKSLVKNIQKLLIGIAIFSSVIAITFAEFILNIFGPTYSQGVVWLQVLVLGQFINLSTGSAVNLLIMTGHEKLHRNNSLFIAILTLALAFILIPEYKALGAAITTTIAIASQNLLSYYFVNKKVYNTKALR
ncbi:oligosaccharide flippase family protein [Thalassotalea sp. M1531]|uniref:Oligosaccharide flippase family protein n=1 Tax=Thalassotalea algicola TaxID=2716224 RepID=A0A7Y0LFZ2_9GAMM|nr:oligosaccharide flippase family protein [Thalassotalea algicola]NMP32956.1 oligosaccharide flippase family protein [Thalassotalea algicola]